MAIKSTYFLISLFTFFIFVNPILAHQRGFTIDLIHRESPLSPLSISSLNQYERVRNSIQRSMSNINRFRSSSYNNVQSRVIPENGEYVMELSYGTPPVPQLGVLDTGSDLIWTQCKPCINCYKQNIPIFDPRKSFTNKIQPYDSKACRALSASESFCSKNNTCGYKYEYGDEKSHSIGEIATETITFRSNGQGVKFPRVIVGCGHDNVGAFRQEWSGIVGLGGGPLSLVSQLKSSFGGKFSYCLIPYEKDNGNFTSKINFGINGKVSGPGVISTPIIKHIPNTYYYLNLKALSIGNSKIPFYKRSGIDRDFKPPKYGGNMIIDTGSTLTFLPSNFFNDFTDVLKNVIKAKRVKDPTGQMPVCYQNIKGGADIDIPDVTVHFVGGDLVWKASNTFLQVSDDVICLAIIPSYDHFGIIGHIAQMDFLVGYDIEQGKLFFKPMDCTKG